MNAAFDAVIDAGKTVPEALEAANRVLQEIEGRVPEWRAQQARQRAEREQEDSRMCAANNLARAHAAARSNPKNPHEIIADVEKSGVSLRLTDDGQLQIAPPGGLPNNIKAYLLEYREQVVAELRRRTQWERI